MILLLLFPLAVAVAALIARHRWTGGWRIAATIPLVAVLLDVGFAAISRYLNADEHPLWPYETMMITAVSAVFLVAAASLRRDTLKKKR